MSRRRRSTKAETRLETLEGRITPTVMSMTHQIIGSQILVLTSGSELSQTGLNRAETVALNKYEHIHNAKKAERFLDHHQNLKEWLERIAATPTPSGTTLPNNPSGTSTSSGSTTTSPSGTGSTTTNSPTTTPQGGTQTPGSSTTIRDHRDPPGSTAPTSPVTTTSNFTGTNPVTSSGGGMDATLRGIYNAYQSGGMAAVIDQYSLLATFSGDSVEVAIHGNGGDFSNLESDITGLDFADQCDHRECHVPVDRRVRADQRSAFPRPDQPGRERDGAVTPAHQLIEPREAGPRTRRRGDDPRRRSARRADRRARSISPGPVAPKVPPRGAGLFSLL